MTPEKFKTLTCGWVFVDASLLHQGIYNAATPCIYSENATIASLKERAKKALCDHLRTEMYLENLDKCALEECTVVTEGTPTYLMEIDGEATIVLAENISDAMDKAAAVAKKEYKMVSKSLPLLF